MIEAMYGLRTEQLDLLTHHREQALDALLVAAAAYTGADRLRETPEGRMLLTQSPPSSSRGMGAS